MQKIIYILIMSAVINAANAQEQTLRRPLRLNAVTNAGVLNGSYGFSGSLQTIVGVAYGGTSLGAGIGLDYYRFRSVPVFAHLARDFGKGDQLFFLYADLGHNYDWLTEKDNKEYPSASGNEFSGGLYYETGLGFKVPFKTNDAFLLSAGYSYKRLKRTVTNNFCPFVGPCVFDLDTYGYEMRRVVVKAAYSF